MAADTTYQAKVYRKQGGEEFIVADGGKIKVESGGTIEVETGGVMTIVDGAFAVGDLSLTTGSMILGTGGKGAALDVKSNGQIIVGNGTTATSVAVSGDITLTNAGVATIGAKAVEDTMISATAGTVLVGTKTDGDVTLLDNSAAGSIVIGQGAGETCAAAAMSGDVTMAATGVVTIAAKAVDPGMVSMTAGNVFAGTKTTNVASAIDISAEGALVIGQGAGETPAAAVLSGDVTMSKTGAVTIAAKAVEDTMIAATAGTVLVGTKTDGDVTLLDISADGAMALGQGAGETPAAYAMSGDVTMTKAGVTTIGAKAVEAAMTAIADGKILIGGAGGAGAEQTLSGDVTVTNAGVTAIGAAKVTSSMLASGAGVAALLTAGLGGSVTVTKASAATDTIIAAHGKDRACLVLVVVDETYAIGTGTLPTVKIGEDDTVEKCMAASVLDTEAAGTVLAFAFTNTATKKIIATTTAAVGNATGGCSITVLAIPTT